MRVVRQHQPDQERQIQALLLLLRSTRSEDSKDDDRGAHCRKDDAQGGSEDTPDGLRSL